MKMPRRGWPFTLLALGWCSSAAAIPVGGGSCDFNDDGFCDAADYTIWRDAFELGGFADANGDGVTDQFDYDVWALDYGANVGSAFATPEPSSAFLAGAALMLRGRRKRGQMRRGANHA